MRPIRSLMRVIIHRLNDKRQRNGFAADIATRRRAVFTFTVGSPAAKVNCTLKV